MSDFQRGADRDMDEDRLPWLEPADNYEDEGRISIVRLVGAVVVGLVALGLIIGGIFWLRNRDAAGGDGSVIAAPEGPYKEKPEEAGGMQVEGTGDVAYGASVGKEVNSTIDLSALPEAPITEGGQPVAPVTPVAVPPSKAPAKPPATQIAAAPIAAPPKAAPTKATAPTAAPAMSAPAGGAIQLGAFSSQALANKAWSQLASRFGFLGALDHNVVSVTVGGKTLYRLRANAGSESGTVCAKLKVAGEACSIVG